MIDSPPMVLQVLPALRAGGVERGTVEMTGAIVAAGGRAIVASAGGGLVAAVERAGGVHVRLPLERKDPVSVWLNGWRLGRLIRAEGVAIVHARSRAPAWSAYWAARRTGVRFVTTWHGSYRENLPGKRRYNAVMARGEIVIAISRYVAGEIVRRHGVAPERVRVIPRGVDAAVFDPAAVGGERVVRLASRWGLLDGAPVILLAARLTRWKGQAVAIEALARMGGDACLVLAGADQGRAAYVAELMRLAVRLGVADRVRLVGDVADMPAALMLADVALSASVAPEGFGRTVIEAQAMGRVVVATDHGGAAETVREGQTGFLAAPGDAAALAGALGRALGLTAAARAAMGAAARAAVCADYTTAAMQQATLGVYDEVLGHGG